MEENIKQQNNEEELDLLLLLHKIWQSRRTIVTSTLVFSIIGILVAILSPKEYTATMTMVPQSSDGKSGGGLSGLAAVAGISLGSSSNEAISMKAYPDIVKSVPFKQKLIQTSVKLDDIDKEISYKKYCEEYAKPSTIDNIIKYTIGLPSLLFTSKEEELSENIENSTILKIHTSERKIFKVIDNQLKLNINEKEGIINLSYSMPEALPAAQMLQSAQKLLQEAITQFKIHRINRRATTARFSRRSRR